MKPRMKAFGVALFAAFALSAVAASAASAVTDHITASQEPATLTAKALNNQVFRPTTAKEERLECKAVGVTGTIVKTQSEVTAEPSYSECKAISGSTEAAATVTINGCHYLFTGVTTTGNPTGGEHASVHIKGCEAAKPFIQIDYTALKIKCIDIPEQEVPDAVRYENDPENPGKSIIIEATAHTLKSETTNNAGVCPTETGKTETHLTGTYTGKVTVSAHNSLLEPVELSVTHT